MNKYNGTDLIEMGIRPGPFMSEAIQIANSMYEKKGMAYEEIQKALLNRQVDIIFKREEPVQFSDFLKTSNDLEEENKEGVLNAMNEVMYSPVVTGGAILPDACPAGAAPVGSVIAVENALVPSYHSADVCCSVALTEFESEESSFDILNTIQALSHWGPMVKEKKSYITLPEEFFEGWSDNRFLQGLHNKAQDHFGTMGDGNHFLSLGERESTGRKCIVSHFGSRGFGAEVYKRGQQAAFKETKLIAKGFTKDHAWLDFDSDVGKDYWSALQVVREWTKRNHFCFHNMIINEMHGRKIDQFWNPHNFVFKMDKTFYHAKGATPNYKGHSHDDSGLTLVPLNMEDPILILEHTNNVDAHGFAPHGAGRNMSRTKWMKANPEPRKPLVDYRFWAGIPDTSELPDAYKCAKTIKEEINNYNLGKVVDQVIPYGCVMAGDLEYHAPWRVKRREKENERQETTTNGT